MCLSVSIKNFFSFIIIFLWLNASVYPAADSNYPVSYTLSQPKFGADMVWQKQLRLDGYFVKTKKGRRFVDNKVKVALKAVLVVGPQQDATFASLQTQIRQMATLARLLRSSGIEVFEYYTPQANYASLKNRISNAHIFIYRGATLFQGSSVKPDFVGGFVFDDQFILRNEIADKIPLAPNALVMLHTNFSAGSSFFNIGALSFQQASKHIQSFYRPFAKLNVSGFIAQWFDEGFSTLCQALLNGKTLQAAWASLPKYSSQSQVVDEDLYPGYRFTMTEYQSGDKKFYANAAIIKPQLKITDFKKSSVASGVAAKTDAAAGTSLREFGFYDGVSSFSPLKEEIKNETILSPVEVYSQKNFQGKKRLVSTDMVSLENIKVLSVKIPTGALILLYSEENFQGSVEVISRNSKNLLRHNIQDQAKSMKILMKTTEKKGKSP